MAHKGSAGAVRRAALSVLFLMIFMAVLAVSARGDELKVFFLDVGEGEAAFVATPGGKTMLIDAGNLITGHRVLEFLEKRGVESIDLFIVTHPHPDHMGGAFFVLQGIEVASRMDNGQPLDGKNDMYRWYGSIFRSGDYRGLSAGAEFELGGVSVEVLSPRGLTRDWNENSVVLRLAYGETVFLLMGDSTVEVEKRLLDSGVDPEADVLKVGHHGAGGSTSGEFLRRVSPEYAVISVNRDNLRGYPSPEVVGRLEGAGAEVVKTYEHGDVVFTSDGRGVRLDKKTADAPVR